MSDTGEIRIMISDESTVGEAVYPEEGQAGPFRMMMYRGIKKESDRLHKEFASDPGDYGCGEYWTDCKEFASGYGDVISKLIVLENVYRIPKDDVLPLIAKYETCKMELGREKRLENSRLLTEMFKSKGYQAVLTYGYESFTIFGLCIFDT
jgi:hypothetical protein